MARTIGKLSALRVKSVAKPGMYADGGGLYLQVGASGSKSWIYRFMLDGRAREMGLGAFNAIDLATARRKAADCRRMRSEGHDPIEARRADREKARLEAARAITFREAAERCIKDRENGWKNKKHADQWRNTLATYAYPSIGTMPVQDIGVEHVLRVLDPIWTEKTETASRVRGRIEAVLGWATTRGYRKGDNPARWHGHLQTVLQERSKVRPVEHHSALPYAEIGNFVESLRAQNGTAARALEFTILTATRTNEVIGATWAEIDFDNKLWIIPAERMKAGREHRVPLAAPALALLKRVKEQMSGAFVFPGGKDKKPLSNMAMLALLRRMDRDDLTVHGFRSTFRDWAAEGTHYPREVAEMALAHTIGDKVEAAYRRGELLEKRRLMMEQWARFCGIKSKSSAGRRDNVVSL